jgi:XTP/dITP diphosphohydrolase
MTIWFASGNVHKKQELAAILTGHRIRIPAGEGGPALAGFDPDERGGTFLENALIKARELYRLLEAAGMAAPVIADDSGLCVDALGGRPGVYSSRYGGGGGEKLSDGERNGLLLAELGDVQNRRARFVCAMVLLYTPDRFFTAQETLEGEIVRGPAGARGSGGFGYDPILYLPDRGRTVAELSAEEKQALSHRGKAGRAIAQVLLGLSNNFTLPSAL